MKILPIALNTLRESARDRVMYNLALLAILLIVASVVMGRIAVGQETKIIARARRRVTVKVLRALGTRRFQRALGK